MATFTSSSLAPWKQQQFDMKNQLMGGLLGSMGYNTYSSYDPRTVYGDKDPITNLYYTDIDRAAQSGQIRANLKNQLLGGIVNSLGYGSQSKPGTTGSMANSGNTSTDWGSNMYNTGAQRLTDTYNKAVQSNINDANRRGLFGSSIAAQASQDTAKAYGQGLAELAANIGAQEAQYGLTQQQINNQRLNTLLGLFD